MKIYNKSKQKTILEIGSVLGVVGKTLVSKI
jgi:hypothetical protein